MDLEKIIGKIMPKGKLDENLYAAVIDACFNLYDKNMEIYFKTKSMPVNKDFSIEAPITFDDIAAIVKKAGFTAEVEQKTYMHIENYIRNYGIEDPKILDFAESILAGKTRAALFRKILEMSATDIAEGKITNGYAVRLAEFARNAEMIDVAKKIYDCLGAYHSSAANRYAVRGLLKSDIQQRQLAQKFLAMAEELNKLLPAKQLEPEKEERTRRKKGSNSEPQQSS